MEVWSHILYSGLLIGILVSAPMGPIGMLVIQRTLSKGRWPAFFTGVGAALSDLAYCLLAGFGLSFITDFIERHQFALQIVGGVVLVVFGAYLFSRNPTRALKTHQTASSSCYGDIASGFALTVSNPLMLFFIIGLFARFNFILPEFGPHHYIGAYAFILAGAICWWYFVTWLVNKLRKRINVRSLWVVNRVIGSILIVMAFVGVGYAFKDYIF